MKNFKQRLGNALIRWGMRLSPTPPVSKTEIKQALQQSTSGVVEANDVPYWKEHQTGNVIVAEPAIMKEFRRNHDKL